MDQTLQRFEDALKAMLPSVPVFHLRTGDVTPPYCAWYVSSDNNFYADDMVYWYNGYSVIVEYYSRTDGEGIELLKKLKGAGYSVIIQDDNWIPQENMWVTIMQVDVYEQ